jgi:hypothetical protein
MSATLELLSGKRGKKHEVKTMADLRFYAWKVTDVHANVAIDENNVVWQDGKRVGQLEGSVEVDK